jgi:arylsulfatase A-like enzyme
MTCPNDRAAEQQSNRTTNRRGRAAAFISIALLPFCSAALPPAAAAADRPNIIFIMADDLGYAEVGCYGQKWIKTPNIDALAADGMKFTQFYAGNAVCAPARCCLMTGKHPGHAFIRTNADPPDRPRNEAKGLFPGQYPIPDSEVTVAEMLKAKGYATAGIGKWGLGYEGSTGDPNKQGFDLFFGYYCQWQAHNHYPRFLWRNGQKVVLEGNTRGATGKHHSQDEFTAEALRFIRANKDKPFFLYLPFIIPHLSIQTTQKWLDMYKGKIPEADYVHKGYIKHPFPRAGYAGMVSQMDDSIGQVMALIKELGLDDNTIVFFTSDNGPLYDRYGGTDSEFFESTGPLRGRKGSLLEGGIRVPLVVRWPGKIKPGTVSDHAAAFWDVMPTLADIAGAAPGSAPGSAPAPTSGGGSIDGLSFAPALLGTGTQKPHEFLYWEFPSYSGQQAVRIGDYKAIRQGLQKNPDAPFQLYNLKDDIGETTDIAAQHPDVIARARRIAAEQHTPSKLFPMKALDGR